MIFLFFLFFLLFFLFSLFTEFSAPIFSFSPFSFAYLCLSDTSFVTCVLMLSFNESHFLKSSSAPSFISLS